MNFDTLIDATTLAGYLHDPALVVVDVRHQLADVGYGERAYAEGHLPGAVFLHCDRDLSGPKTGTNGRHPLPAVVVAALARACPGSRARRWAAGLAGRRRRARYRTARAAGLCFSAQCSG